VWTENPGEGVPSADRARVVPPGREDAHLVLVSTEHADLGEYPAAVLLPIKMYRDLEGSSDLAAYGVSVEGAERAEGFQPSRHLRGAVGMQRPAATGMTGVERGQ
jgi:hypothetical protein